MGDFLFDDCQKFHFSTSGFDYDLPEWGDILVYQQVLPRFPLLLCAFRSIASKNITPIIFSYAYSLQYPL